MPANSPSKSQFYRWGIDHPNQVEQLGDGQEVPIEEIREAVAETSLGDSDEEGGLRDRLLACLRVRPAGLKSPRDAAWLDRALARLG